MVERYILRNVLTLLKEAKDELRQFKTKVGNTNNEQSLTKGIAAATTKQKICAT